MAFLPQFMTFESLFKNYFNFGDEKEESNKKDKVETKKTEPKELEEPEPPKNNEVNISPILKKSKKKKSGSKHKSDKNKDGKKKHHRNESNTSLTDLSENKENNNKTENNKDKITEKKSENKDINKLLNSIHTSSIDEDQAIKKLTRNIKKFLFRTKVKTLIKLHKENFAIVCTNSNDDLTLCTYLEEDEVHKFKLNYEPILQQNIAYIPRKMLGKRNLLKFTFVNKNNEVIIDPKYNTEFDSGTFINVINLKKIKLKEEEREEDFQTFLENYFTVKAGQNRIITSNTKLTLEEVRPKKKHKTLDIESKMHFKHENKSCIGLSSILRPRQFERVPSNKKISFGNVKYSYYKNK